MKRRAEKRERERERREAGGNCSEMDLCPYTNIQRRERREARVDEGSEIE